MQNGKELMFSRIYFPTGKCGLGPRCMDWATRLRSTVDRAARLGSTTNKIAVACH
jgi:hypothetical protein